MEGLGEQEQEFEAARRFVRLAGTAAQLAARAPRHAPPRQVAQRAIATAARRQLAALSRGGVGGVGAGTGVRRRLGYGMRRPARSIYGGYPRRRYPSGYRRSRYGYRRPSYAGYGATGYAGDYSQPVSGVPMSGAPASGGGYGGGGGGYGGANEGRWIRRHGKIILLGA